jgi:hypothetical protein
VSGNAIINYNKKKGKWGWKAIDISIEKSSDDDYVISEGDEF